MTLEEIKSKLESNDREVIEFAMLVLSDLTYKKKIRLPPREWRYFAGCSKAMGIRVDAKDKILYMTKSCKGLSDKQISGLSNMFLSQEKFIEILCTSSKPDINYKDVDAQTSWVIES